MMLTELDCTLAVPVCHWRDQVSHRDLVDHEGHAVDWYSTLQKTIVSTWTDESVDIIATSTANSELVAVGAAQSRALHLPYIADELGITAECPIRISIDASAAN